MKIITNGARYTPISYTMLPDEVKKGFDYLLPHPAALHDARFVKYRKTWYDVLDTQRIVVGAKHTERMGWAMYVQPCNEFAKWHAIVSETYFSGVLFRFIPDEGHVICGRYCS